MESENKMMKYMSGKIIYTNSMDKKVFVNYQDSSQLICFWKKENKAIPKPHRSVRQMV